MTESLTADSDRKKGVAVTGSVLGAVLLSSCCIAPLVLITLGASGAWIGQLTAMKAYQPVFLLFTTGFLGYGFWRVYGKSNQQCADESCATAEIGSRFESRSLGGDWSSAPGDDYRFLGAFFLLRRDL